MTHRPNVSVQPLEARKLLSAAVENGILTITGTAKNDNIVVSLNAEGTEITVRETTRKSRFKKATTTTGTFDAAEVTSIVVNAGAGDDVVQLLGAQKKRKRSAEPATFGVNAILNGEDGNDRLYGADGDDQLNGGAGDDDLFGNGGADLLDGGDGDDLLDGGDGIDTLIGGAGDDLLKSAGDGEVDILDGGADSAADGEEDGDQAIADEDETATNVAIVDIEDVWFGPPAFGGHGFGGGLFGKPGPQFGGHGFGRH